jgi:hypothetical protein
MPLFTLHSSKIIAIIEMKYKWLTEIAIQFLYKFNSACAHSVAKPEYGPGGHRPPKNSKPIRKPPT